MVKDVQAEIASRSLQVNASRDGGLWQLSALLVARSRCVVDLPYFGASLLGPLAFRPCFKLGHVFDNLMVGVPPRLYITL